MIRNSDQPLIISTRSGRQMRMNDESRAFCDAIQIFCRSPVQPRTADRHRRDHFLAATCSFTAMFSDDGVKAVGSSGPSLALRFLVQTMSDGPLGGGGGRKHKTKPIKSAVCCRRRRLICLNSDSVTRTPNNACLHAAHLQIICCK